MSSTDRVNVALFIDWDNLAISTAADLGGALPDVRAVVQRAQQYGTLIIAKAYAEWQATSERLSVYRAGVEPVYAPTFRFEPDTPTSQGRGKSLADPCMVADCVDALHLFPDITVYVIVTGDKDMIPVVRLAQLRGRKVIVIGPDYVAGVLREMADEFIPYRSLVDMIPARPHAEPRRHAAHAAGTDEPARRRSSERHAPASFARQERAPIAPPAPPAPPALAAPAPTPMQIAVATAVRPKPAGELVEQAPEPVEERGQPEDLRAVFNGIVGVLQQRADEGRDRIRATNLKDALMQRMPGFTERKYGFAKFKDLLTSAQKAGLISVTMAGPVHWISLAGTPVEAKTPVADVPVAVPAEQPAPTEVTAAQLEERRSDLIRFIYELRERSRWLTYTYVLTNLISYFGKSLPQAAAENRARDTLNYLVQQGILRVDKEPQEVEVGGARHRVRMCHLNTHHELVVEALGFTPDEGADERGDSASEAQTEASGEGESVSASIVATPALETVPEEETASPPVPEEAATGHVDDHQFTGTLFSGNGPVAQGSVPGNEEHAIVAQPAVDEAAGAPVTEPQAVAEEHVDSGSGNAQSQPVETDSEREAEPQPAANARTVALEAAFAALERVVFESTSSEKPTISASTLRSRLVQALRSFNERQFGFSRFKDFLLAAQDHGVVRVESRGYVTWVSMPRQSSPEAEPKS